MLSHSQARSIAEARWGRGGTNSEPTTRDGAFYFSCSGHGGFVIDKQALKVREREALEPYVEFEKATEYVWGRKRWLMHPYRTRSARVPVDAITIHREFILLEEDCDWCLTYKFTGIKFRGKQPDEESVERTFNQLIKPRATA